jgi:hypothetical protein
MYCDYSLGQGWQHNVIIGPIFRKLKSSGPEHKKKKKKKVIQNMNYN